MKRILSFARIDDDASRERLQELFDQHCARLEERLSRFHDDLVQLEARLERFGKPARARISLRLMLPHATLAVREEGEKAAEAMAEAFRELERKMQRSLARLRKDHEWKRPRRRAAIAARLQPARDDAERERREIFFGLVEDHLEDVYNLVRRELIYLESAGDVREGALSVNGMMDAVILRALAEFERRPSEFSVGEWLRKIAIETICDEARKARCAIPEDAASTEREPERPAEDPTESDQEMFEFYQPDDLLLLEDLIADESASDPETQSSSELMQQALHRAMAMLPQRWRQVVTLLDFEEMDAEQVAQTLGCKPAEVERIARAAHDFLRERVREAGPDGQFGDVEDEARAMVRELGAGAKMPMPLTERERIASALREKGEAPAAATC